MLASRTWRGIFAFAILVAPACSSAQNPQGCPACHDAAMPFGAPAMRDAILSWGMANADPDACTLCHGGTPDAASQDDAHRGGPRSRLASIQELEFQADPGRGALASITCETCHAGYAARWLKSSMSTGVGAIQSRLCEWAWRRRASRAGEEIHVFGKGSREDEDGRRPAAGSAAYLAGMAAWMEAEPAAFPSRLHAPPERPWEGRTFILEGASVLPSCLACHGEDGSARRAGADDPGCSACHEIHAAGSAERRLVSDESCFACHFDPRGWRLSELGPVMSHYAGPDHADGGLLCMDCHTSIEMHGDGNIPSSAALQTEIRCEDCHGTLQLSPWELPLAAGFGEDRPDARGKARGVMAPDRSSPSASEQGALLSSRGNAMGNVVRQGDAVTLESASGRSYPVPILKSRLEHDSWSSQRAREAKASTAGHRDMACLQCHADWAPPCIGCHASAEESARR